MPDDMMFEDDFRAEFDARTLADANEIRKNSARLGAAIDYMHDKAAKLNAQAESLSGPDESDLERGYTSLGRL